MQRTINHTGRRKLKREEVSIKLMEEPDKSPEFDVDFRLEQSGLPANASIYLEAYSSNTLQRFHWGTVEKISRPDNRVLDRIDLSANTLFRVRIVDESDHLGRLLASAHGLRAASDEDADDKASLITLRSRPLGQQTWIVSIPESGKPELVINSTIPQAIEQLRSNPLFQSLILPAALRQVLTFYLWEGEFEEGSVQEQWLSFAEHFAGDKPHSDDTSELTQWVDLVVERFSERFQLREMLNLKLEETL